MIQTVLRKVMESAAIRKKIDLVVAEGVFINTSNNSKALNLPGAVYGFCVQLSDDERNALFAEAKLKKTSRFDTVSDWRPLQDDIYPLYWGKDKMLGARIYQHLMNTKATGLARLCAYTNLHGKNIACVALTVTHYSDLERELQSTHPHLLLAVTRVL